MLGYHALPIHVKGPSGPDPRRAGSAHCELRRALVQRFSDRSQRDQFDGGQSAALRVPKQDLENLFVSHHAFLENTMINKKSVNVRVRALERRLDVLEARRDATDSKALLKDVAAALRALRDLRHAEKVGNRRRRSNRLS